jgi:hypothetical protein
LSVWREKGEQGQPVLLLLAVAAVRLWREGSRRCLGYRIVRLSYQMLVAEFSLSLRVRMTLRLGIFWFLSQTYYNAMPTQGVGDTYL